MVRKYTKRNDENLVNVIVIAKKRMFDYTQIRLPVPPVNRAGLGMQAIQPQAKLGELYEQGSPPAMQYHALELTFT